MRSRSAPPVPCIGAERAGLARGMFDEAGGVMLQGFVFAFATLFVLVFLGRSLRRAM